MTQRDVRTFLEDVDHAASDLARFIADREYESFADDELLVAAVERRFEIIGEALRQAEKLDPSLPEHISDYRRIIDFRNIIAHAYMTVSTQAVWYILIRKLPVLHREVWQLLEQYGQQ